MGVGNITGTTRGLGISAVIFGALGGIFYWWVPLGMVLSLAGLLLGLIDGTLARRRSLDFRLSLFAILLSLGTLALDIFIALQGMQTVTFGGQ